MQQQPTTRDEVLFWLNGLVGRSVDVSVVYDLGDYGASVLAAEGELHHWRQDAPQWAAVPRDDMAGLYTVGRANVDLSDLGQLEFWFLQRDEDAAQFDEVEVELGENVTLRIVAERDE
jgi:hypothetical protein